MTNPPIGSRVTVRYRESDGGQTDVIGHLVSGPPVIEVRAADSAEKTVRIDAADVVAVRELSHAPVRNSQIRDLEHAAALAWPGTEQHRHRGWLLRAAHGHTRRANSAVPLDFGCSVADIPAIADFYARRGLAPWLSLPERLLAVRAAGIERTAVLVADVNAIAPPDGVVLTDRPDRAWLECYRRDVPPDVLTAVIDGDVAFACADGVAVGRGAVTTAPDGTRWLGISSVRVSETAHRRGHARSVCTALQNWGAGAGATRAYVRVLTDNTEARTLYASLGFGLHHSARYIDARTLVTN